MMLMNVRGQYHSKDKRLVVPVAPRGHVPASSIGRCNTISCMLEKAYSTPNKIYSGKRGLRPEAMDWM